mgnify:FL=1
MLNVYFGSIVGELRVADGWFDNQLSDKYYVTEFSKKAIKNIDKSEVICEDAIMSPVFGIAPITAISGGAKGVIVLRYTDKIVNLVSVGDNCITELLSILEFKDLTVSSLRFVDFYKYGYTGVITILNDDTTVNNSLELFNKYRKYTKEY